MARINWGERLRATAIHLIVTTFLTGIVALLIFRVWFPSGLASVSGGLKLFLLVVTCDAALGPLMSLVIYNSSKSRKELLFDYSIVAAVQLAALGYGVFVVSQARPVTIAYNEGQLEIVSATEIVPYDLDATESEAYATSLDSGPRLVSIARPTNQKESSNLKFAEALGSGPAKNPKYYRPYSAALGEVRDLSNTMERLLDGSGAQEQVIRKAIANTHRDAATIRWLPVRHRFGSAVALLDAETLQPIEYIAIDPVWIK